MNRFFKWLERWLPGVWAVLTMFTITGVLIALNLRLVIRILELLGVL